MSGLLVVRQALPAPFSSEDEERAIKEKYLDAIQQFAKVKLTPDDVHVRGMYLCNSAPDFYYSRFTHQALRDVAEMLPGRSYMVGHNYDNAPIGRFFHADTVYVPKGRTPKSETLNVRGLFYVPKDAEGDAIVRRIDTGVWREVSIGFRCLDAPCTICRDFIGTCGHWPGEVYDRGMCLYDMDGVNAVYEGSSVFAGGQKDTSYFVPDGARSRTVAPGSYTRDEISAMLAGETDDLLIESELKQLKRDLASVGLRDRERDEPRRGQVQAVTCSRERFESVSEAKQWCRENDFRVDKGASNDEAFEYHQVDADRFEDGSFKNITLTQGVRAKVGRKKDAGRGRGQSVEEFMAAG